MHRQLIVTLTGFLALLPQLAQAQGSFADYQKRKAQQQKEYLDRKAKAYDDYITQKRKQFEEYRRKKNEEFAKYMEQPWRHFNIEEALKQPIEEDVPPVIYDEKKDNREYKEQKVEVVPYETPQPKPQPKPIVPIEEDNNSSGYGTFIYYGTQMKVRWGDLKSFKLASITEKALAQAFLKLTDKRYDNLLHDCLALRSEYSLCDWAYYKMLETLAAEICGKGTNEAVFLQGTLYNQSGYMMRFAYEKDNHKLHLLSRMIGGAYDCKYVHVGGKVFYLFDGCECKDLNIFEKGYGGEQEMSMNIDRLPKLTKNLSASKAIKANSYPFQASIRINKNLIDFFNDYPTSCSNNNFLTRWAYYANTPLSEEVKQELYPALRTAIKNATPLMAANMLLNWVQPSDGDNGASSDGVQKGFPYGYDDKIWGTDRAFFAEETLYYPFSDCEDHAILFSHLVRDLLGLDVALVYYPGHLATAICFPSDVDGDFILVDGRKFVIADPTYSRAPVGRTMPSVDQNKAQTIVCKRLNRE